MILRWSLAFCLATVAFAQDIVPGRYIVELTGEPAIVHQDRSSRRREIRNEQQTLERVLRTRRATVRARVDTVANALIVDAPDQTGLTSLPGVRRVEPVRRFQPLLTRALSTHHVPEAWEVIGGMERAGEGIKIGILDSGLNTDHPGFAEDGMTAPDGFPQASSEENLQLTNGKVIVARAFDGGTIQDVTGHGTGVAMAAAGVQHLSPRGTISGVAPRAWLGIYRVTNQEDRYYRTDDILLGLDAAVKDGMDVLNLSFGSVGTTGAAGDSVFEGGTRRAMEAGILVVHAAGNTPGAQTVDDAASSEKEIAVGANTSVAAGNTSVIPSAGRSYPAAESNNVTAQAPIEGPVVDTATLDGNLLGCDAYSVSLEGQIPLIQRGGCLFSEKLANAAAAGAATAIVYNSPDPPDGNPEALVFMSVDANPTIPGIFIGYSNGLKLKELIQTVEDLTVQLRFPFGFPNSVAYFSSSGPSIGDLGIKPDLLATGTSFYTAAVYAPAGSCSLCDLSGYTTVQGTSFSAPLAAGAAAVIKGARPGLTADDYRSLLINSAAPMILADGSTANVMAAGTGILNLKNAVTSTIAAAPVSLSFGAGEGTVDQSRELTLKNLGAEPATWTLTVDSVNETKPALSTETLTVEPGESAPVQLTFLAAGLTAGASEGFVKVEDTATGAVARIPYWYAVTGGEPASVTVLSKPDSASAGSPITLIVRVHDAAGLILPNSMPSVSPVLGGGTVVSVTRFSPYPGSWRLNLQLGQRGANSFRIEAGNATYTFSITAD